MMGRNDSSISEITYISLLPLHPENAYKQYYDIEKCHYIALFDEILMLIMPTISVAECLENRFSNGVREDGFAENKIRMRREFNQ